MPTFKDRSVLSGMKVSQAMQRVVMCMPMATPIFRCIRQILKRITCQGFGQKR